MPLPFVSRGRYDDAQKQIEELKRDKERLTDRIALLTGQPPLYAERPAVAAVPAVVPAKRPDGEQPKARMTRKELLQWGNKEAARRARVPGAMGVVAEMQQAAEAGRKMAVATERLVEDAG